MRRSRLAATVLLPLLTALGGVPLPADAQTDDIPVPVELATFAGGCFWCMEPPFEGLPGVRSVTSGYTGGPEEYPTYRRVSSGRTGHAEAVQIDFDPEIIRYEELLEIYWRSVDPTDGGGQFADRGRQYRPGIFYHDEPQRRAAEASKAALAASARFEKPLVVAITAFDRFWPAEEYHQDYYEKNPVHYKAYALGSGREGFLERVWKDDDFVPGGETAAAPEGASDRED